MRIRPCIDIHDGHVKQIVGGSICDGKKKVSENFVSFENASHYADIYRQKGLAGGHIILLNSKDSEALRYRCAQGISGRDADRRRNESGEFR